MRSSIGDVPILVVRSRERSSRRGNSSRTASPPRSYHTNLKEDEDEEVSLSFLCRPKIRGQDSLERDEQLQEVRRDFSSVPRPYDEDLGYVDEKGDEEDRPSNPVSIRT
jgi:hypothetical protein